MANEKTAVSLFCGAGGMDVGFSRAGFKTLLANDNNQDACRTYARNFGDHVVCGSIDPLIPLLSPLRDQNVDCVFGGPPCQGFSIAGHMDLQDPRSLLVSSFMNAVGVVNPRCFVMENVKTLATLEKFRHVRDSLFLNARDLGYKAELILVNARDYGVPQNRERMFFVGFRDCDLDVSLAEMAKLYQRTARTVRDSISHLGRAGSNKNKLTVKAKITFAKNPVLRKSPYAGMLFNGAGRPIEIDGFAPTIAASIGGNRTPIIDEATLYDKALPWIVDYHQHLLHGGEVYSDSEVPKRLRRLTLREARLLQTFPEEFEFLGKQVSIFNQIGNAVPCDLAECMARMVGAILDRNS